MTIPVGPAPGTIGPVGDQGPAPLEGQATAEKAWWLFMQRIGKHNPTLYQSGGKALDAVNNLMRTH